MKVQSPAFFCRLHSRLARLRVYACVALCLLTSRPASREHSGPITATAAATAEECGGFRSVLCRRRQEAGKRHASFASPPRHAPGFLSGDFLGEVTRDRDRGRRHVSPLSSPLILKARKGSRSSRSGSSDAEGAGGLGDGEGEGASLQERMSQQEEIFGDEDMISDDTSVANLLDAEASGLDRDQVRRQRRLGKLKEMSDEDLMSDDWGGPGFGGYDEWAASEEEEEEDEDEEDADSVEVDDEDEPRRKKKKKSRRRRGVVYNLEKRTMMMDEKIELFPYWDNRTYHASGDWGSLEKNQDYYYHPDGKLRKIHKNLQPFLDQVYKERRENGTQYGISIPESEWDDVKTMNDTDGVQFKCAIPSLAGNSSGLRAIADKFLDEKTFKELESQFDPKELERIRMQDYWLYSAPFNDTTWIPDTADQRFNITAEWINGTRAWEQGFEFILKCKDEDTGRAWDYRLWAPNRATPYRLTNGTDISFNRYNADVARPGQCDKFDFYERSHPKILSLAHTPSWEATRSRMFPRKDDNGTLRGTPTDYIGYKAACGFFPSRQMEPVWDYQRNGLLIQYQSFWNVTKRHLHPHPDFEYYEGIKFKKLGRSDVEVPEFILGTMTWGTHYCDWERCTDMMDFAFGEYGIAAYDTSELYPYPIQPKYYGKAEEVIGRWMKLYGNKVRDKVTILSGCAGRSERLSWIRDEKSVHPDRPGGGTRLSKWQILKACDDSLKRLQTDHIDVFQLQWPDRYYPSQASGDYEHLMYDFEKELPLADEIPLEEQVAAIGELLRKGKIRAWGLCNETPWGVLQFSRVAKKMGVQPPASVQMPYNLMNRNDVEKGFVEMARPQNLGIGILANAPLAGGILSGKYLEAYEYSTRSRLVRFPSYMKRFRASIANRFVTDLWHEYLAQERERETNLGCLAMKYVNSRPFVASTIVGVNDRFQLREDLHSQHTPMTDRHERACNLYYYLYRDPLRIIQ
uniref:NADP-dependent oxidoreductase domain-containing protein n=1 Tax=Chromera velia CCMP2878 TaxID=1169474 RepID=A0A0G4I610_9ALVE